MHALSECGMKEFQRPVTGLPAAARNAPLPDSRRHTGETTLHSLRVQERAANQRTGTACGSPCGASRYSLPCQLRQPLALGWSRTEIRILQYEKQKLTSAAKWSGLNSRLSRARGDSNARGECSESGRTAALRAAALATQGDIPSKTWCADVVHSFTAQCVRSFRV